MNNKPFINVLIISFIGGLFLYAYQKHWIVFQFPRLTLYNSSTENGEPTQKITITGWWHTKERWYQETSSIIWNTPENNIMQVLNYWFETALQEKCIYNEVHVETVALTQQHEALISLDMSPFTNSMSIYEKLMIMEGILKTLRTNNIKIQYVRFLLHHQPLYDNHLDLMQRWHIAGYINL